MPWRIYIHMFILHNNSLKKGKIVFSKDKCTYTHILIIIIAIFKQATRDSCAKTTKQRRTKKTHEVYI